MFKMEQYEHVSFGINNSLLPTDIIRFMTKLIDLTLIEKKEHLTIIKEPSNFFYL